MGHDPSYSIFIIHPGAAKGGERMSPIERRQQLLEVLNLRRQDTYDNLASEFDVSRRTICRDIAVLMCSYPIETARGYAGGVKIAEWFHLNTKTFTHKQAALLRKLREQLAGDDIDTLNGILREFAP